MTPKTVSLVALANALAVGFVVSMNYLLTDQWWSPTMSVMVPLIVIMSLATGIDWKRSDEPK